MQRAHLVDLARHFVDGFNRNDLDSVMSFFADDAIYDEFNGKRNVGKAASALPSNPSSRAHTARCSSSTRISSRTPRLAR